MVEHLPVILTTQDVANFLRISIETVRRLHRAGVLPAIANLRALRFRREVVAAFVTAARAGAGVEQAERGGENGTSTANETGHGAPAPRS